MTSRVNRSIKNISAGLANRFLSLAVPFIIRTLIIQKLGMEYLGLNSLFSSILQMLSLTELGFGSAMVFSMYKPIAENDNATVCALLNFYKRIYHYIGIIILAIGLLLMPFLKNLIASDYPQDINIYSVYLIYLANTVISYFLFAYKSSLLTACMRSDVDSNITSICNLFMYIFQAGALYLTSNYYVYAVLLPIFTLLNNIIRSCIVDKKYPQYKCSGELDRRNLTDIRDNVIALAGHRLGGVVFSSVDSVVISAFLGLIILGKYSNYFYIYNAVNGVMMIIFQSIIAVIGNSIVTETRDKNLMDFQRLFFANGWIVGFCAICFLCLYQPFIKLWVGSNNMLEMSIPLLLSLYFYISNIRRVETTFKDAAGMWKADFWKPYISVLVNLTLNIILVNVWGLEGVIVSSIVDIVFVEIPWEVHVLFNKYFQKKETLYYKSFLEITAFFFLTALITFLICTLAPEGIIGLFLRGVICITVPNMLFIMAFREKDEFQYWKIKIKEILRK